jgi:hypothetical protein
MHFEVLIDFFDPQSYRNYMSINLTDLKTTFHDKVKFK